MSDPPIKEDPEPNWSKSLRKSLRVLSYLLFLLVILVGGQFVRSIVVQNAADRTVTAANKATEAAQSAESVSVEGRDASLETLNQIRQALEGFAEANAEEPSLNNQQIIDALQAISRLEYHICGGPCPEPGG